MAVATSFTSIITASKDNDLLARFGAAAAEAGIENPLIWVQQNAAQLAAQTITSAGDTIASVYAYAAATHMPPGANEAAVTDDFIRQAVAQVTQPSA